MARGTRAEAPELIPVSQILKSRIALKQDLSVALALALRLRIFRLVQQCYISEKYSVITQATVLPSFFGFILTSSKKCYITTA